MYSLLAQGRYEAELVQRGWTHVVDQAADVSNRCLHVELQLGEELISSVRIVLEQVAGGVEPKREAGECRTEFVVQVASQAPTLLLASRDEPFARPLEISGEPNGVCGHPSLISNLLEQPVIGSGERFIRDTWGEQQTTNAFALVDERQHEQLILGKPPRSDDGEGIALRERNCCIRHLEGLRYGLNNSGQHSLGSERDLQALTQAREYRVGVVTLAVHQSVDGSLQTGA